VNVRDREDLICRWLQGWAASARSGGEGAEFVEELLKHMKERGMTIGILGDTQ